VDTDEALMAAVRGGSREAFEALFERYRGAIWRFFRRRTADAARAEELAQDVFLAVLQGSVRYEPRAPFRAYLFGVAYNVLHAARRKTRPVAPLDADPPAPAPDPDDAMWVRAALARLDAGDREILMLREYEQLTYQEIADLRRMPLNTVRSRLFRARMALRAQLTVEVRESAKVGHE
jgi:RNA polymerase sigma-70 factor, ECF subfamily